MAIPDYLTETDSSTTIDLGKVVYFKIYRSNAKCESAGQFSYFLAQGWDKDRMTPRINKGGMKTISFDFRRDDYLVNVECQTDAIVEDQKKVVILILGTTSVTKRS